MRASACCLVWILGLLAPGFGCSGSSKKLIEVGSACQFNRDCDPSLLCTMGKCHEMCRISNDCPIGQSCVLPPGGVPVCQLPTETNCVYDSDCAPLKCAIDRRCHDECQSSMDCTLGRRCTQQKVCAEPYQIDRTESLIPANVDGWAADSDASTTPFLDAAEIGSPDMASDLRVNLLADSGIDAAIGSPDAPETGD